MISIYHNPRCSKSREALQLLEANTSDFKVIKYLDDVLTGEDLENIIKLLGITPIDLVRKNEAVWKENFKNSNLTDTEIIAAMAKHPKLIERPIVINGNKAVIGRPPHSILDIL
ncbi:arsenate reductase (glutaredoxin) [Gelidibacter salicanalis]|uniref:Arsenate reductase (Glutaredoxin) n=1 Tax=Gelidibacter salicanalis TaxID=291193 RepID=A0A934NHK9_9FLAO|nr:arsenate reductase (glutaredoxin) [Gelidibacter salicanalis]MBJ7879898.1 arsenate reductase (glutaredoxin) [Gelidibacter salicanalis]